MWIIIVLDAMLDSHEADWRKDKRIFLIYQQAYQSANKEVIWRLKETFEKQIFIRSTIVATKSTKENRKKDTDELLNSAGGTFTDDQSWHHVQKSLL